MDFAYSFLFGATYALCYTPLTALVASEAMDSNTRAKGLALSTVIVNAMLFLNQFAGPIALGNITSVILVSSSSEQGGLIVPIHQIPLLLGICGA